MTRWVSAARRHLRIVAIVGAGIVAGTLAIGRSEAQRSCPTIDSVNQCIARCKGNQSCAQHCPSGRNWCLDLEARHRARAPDPSRNPLRRRYATSAEMVKDPDYSQQYVRWKTCLYEINRRVPESSDYIRCKGLDPKNSLPPPAAARPASKPPAAPAWSSETVAGVWRGTYRCRQGLSAVTISLQRESADRLAGIFAFAPHSSNPGTPSGRYAVLATVNRETQTLQIVPQKWIRQPPGYMMVGAKLIPNGGNRALKGVITDPSCGDINISR